MTGADTMGTATPEQGELMSLEEIEAIERIIDRPPDEPICEVQTTILRRLLRTAYVSVQLHNTLVALQNSDPKVLQARRRGEVVV